MGDVAQCGLRRCAGAPRTSQHAGCQGARRGGRRTSWVSCVLRIVESMAYRSGSSCSSGCPIWRVPPACACTWADWRGRRLWDSQPWTTCRKALHLWIQIAASTTATLGRLPAGSFCEALSVRHGLLRCVDGQAQAQLLHLVAQACGHHAQGLAGALCLTAGSALRLMVTVLPLAQPCRCVPPAAHGFAGNGGCRYAIFWPESRTRAGSAGFVAPEARLAVLLATGRTVKDYARIEGCSWHTARTHMKNLMRKTGCHRQVELVGLLQSLQPR